MVNTNIFYVLTLRPCFPGYFARSWVLCLFLEVPLIRKLPFDLERDSNKTSESVSESVKEGARESEN